MCKLWGWQILLWRGTDLFEVFVFRWMHAGAFLEERLFSVSASMCSL